MSAGFEELSLLALIQGLTEFLPVSSSGHLVLAQRALSFERTPLSIDVALHVGTLLAVLLIYRRSLWRLVRQALSGELREVGLLALASVPVALVGLTLRDAVESAFASAHVAAWGLLATAVILFVGDQGRRRTRRAGLGAERPLGWRIALLVGCAQAVAILPGVSRSGTTISAGLLCGLRPDHAARFSFLLSIPAILGASLLALPDLFGSADPADGADGAAFERPGAALLTWAVLFAGFVGWGALRALLAFLDRGAFAWFGAYCAVLGLGVLAFV